MNRKRKKRRSCPRCQTPLILQHELTVCPQCLLIWRGDTFEPLTRDLLGLSSLYDYFFQT